MVIFLGNLTIEDIENEHNFMFNDEERQFLKDNWHQNASFVDGECGWHFFDIPRFLVVSNGNVGKECLNIFMNHNSDYKYQFKGGYGNSTEDTY